MENKLLKTIRLKELNNLNTDEEYVELIEIIAESLENGDIPEPAKEPDPVPDVPEDPLEASLVIYPIYDECFARLQSAYTALLNNPGEDACKDNFFVRAVEFAKISSFLGLKVLDYAYSIFIPEYRFPDLPEHPFLSTADLENLSPLEKIVKVYFAMEVTHRHVYDALSSKNKSQLIALGALLSNSARDLLKSIG